MTKDTRFAGEPTNWSLALIGFYLACTVVGIGAAVAAIVLVVFPSAPFAPAGATAGILMVVGGAFASWRFLKAARREL